MSDQPNIALYCHLPWCIEKCPYCDFNSFKKNPQDSFVDYTNAICSDIISSAQYAKQRSISSIFFGGGTPSLFPSSQIEAILYTIKQYYQLTSQCEITLEMNPQSAEIKKIQDYYHMGINRLSIGAQSFNDRLLKNIGRIHNETQIHEAITQAQSCGFQSINVDIMYGLPEQSLAEVIHDLECAIAYSPEHISWYELTLEANTYFAKHPPRIPDSDTHFNMASAGWELLNQSGYNRYEISAFSRPNRQCQHNINYWNFGDYIGVGNGASSKITRDAQIKRYQKHKNPALYQQAPEREIQIHIVAAEDVIFEYMLNKLRLLESFSLSENTLPINIAVGVNSYSVTL